MEPINLDIALSLKVYVDLRDRKMERMVYDPYNYGFFTLEFFEAGWIKELIDNPSKIQGYLKTVNNYYRPYDPGSYLYKILLSKNSKIFKRENIDLIYKEIKNSLKNCIVRESQVCDFHLSKPVTQFIRNPS